MPVLHKDRIKINQLAQLNQFSRLKELFPSLSDQVLDKHFWKQKDWK